MEFKITIIHAFFNRILSECFFILSDLSRSARAYGKQLHFDFEIIELQIKFRSSPSNSPGKSNPNIYTNYFSDLITGSNKSEFFFSVDRFSLQLCCL